MTQQQLADQLSITRSKLNALESGQTAAPQPEDYLKYSDYFKVSIDTLMRVDLGKLGELKLRDLQAGNDVYMAGSNLRILAITVDKSNKENVEYVPVKAKAGYRDGFSDPEYIASLPRYSLPNLPAGTFRIFPTTGDSMLPLPEGTDVVCRFVEDWTTLRPETLCILILRGEQDFVFKKVTINTVDKTALLESFNPVYQSYQIATGDILEIWKMHSYHSKKLPEAASDPAQISMKLNEILARLTTLENRSE